MKTWSFKDLAKVICLQEAAEPALDAFALLLYPKLCNYHLFKPQQREPWKPVEVHDLPPEAEMPVMKRQSATVAVEWPLEVRSVCELLFPFL